MTHQWICVVSDDVESAVLAATFYRIYSGELNQAVKTTRQCVPREVEVQLTLEKPVRVKLKRQSSGSRNVTVKKPRRKSLKCDGQWKIVLTQFVN